jgi:isochorismate hydrolase
MPYRVERIDPQRTVLIVVDMENDFVAPGAPLETPAGRAMLPTLKRAITFCRERGIRVIYTTTPTDAMVVIWAALKTSGRRSGRERVW